MFPDRLPLLIRIVMYLSESLISLKNRLRLKTLMTGVSVEWHQPQETVKL